MKTFQELDLIAPLGRALADENYDTPTPIQAQTIPAALDGRDVLGCAQTGTGKTAAFALPILDRLGEQNRKATPNRPLALVLAPTRELALQIGESFATYGKHLRLRQAIVFGGVNQGQQVRSLARGAHLLIATPGRLLDLMEQGYIELDRLEMFVLDEADRMLDMGFLPDLKRIIRELPDRRQSLFFSATLPPKIKELAAGLLRDPVTVNVTPKKTSVEQITQQVVFVGRDGKLDVLQQVLQGDNVQRVIVFTRTKRGANQVSEKLEKRGIRSTAIHGNKSQAARTRALDAFRRDRIRVLVATDVAARGIDVDNISHVINYDIPEEPESYVHRIGRTGRAGATGIALSFCSAAERGDLRAIEQLIGQKVPLAPEALQPAKAERESREETPRGRGGFGASRRGTAPSGSRRSDRKTARPARASSGTSRVPSGELSQSNRRRPRRKTLATSSRAS